MQPLNQEIVNKICLSKEARDTIKQVYDNRGIGNSTQKTDYHLFDKDRKLLKKADNTACFAGLPNLLGTIKDAVYVKVLPYQTVDKDLIKDSWAIVRWLELCQTAGAFPKSQSVADILSDGLWVDLRDKEVNPVSFYIWGCLFRYVSEYPRSVYNAVKLIDEGGHDFWASVVVTQYLAGGLGGHNFLNVGDNPYSGGAQHRPELVMLLHRWARNPKAIDERHLLTAAREGKIPGYYGVPWQGNDRAAKPNDNGLKLGLFKDPVYCLADALKPLWRATTKAQIEEQVAIIKEELPDAFK